MQWPAAQLTVGALAPWDVLWMSCGGVVVIVTVVALLAHPRRRVDDRVFQRLLHRVHDRREMLFGAHYAVKHSGMTRERFLRSARERLRGCAFFQRKGDS